jgi:predicted amidohydrolase YtcJ
LAHRQRGQGYDRRARAHHARVHLEPEVIQNIFTAARIHTFNSEPTRGRALVVSDGRIGALTSVDTARRIAPDADVIDYGECTITPGLIDSHIHLTEWSAARAQADLSDARSLDTATQLVGAAKQNAGWVLGRGWSAHNLGGYPDRAALDAVVPDAPVALQSHDMHALWLNTCALQLIGVDSMQNDPDGGRIVRRENGEPTGVLLENAAQLVVPYLPRYTVASLANLVADAQQELHSYGIVGVHSFPGVHLREPDPFPVVQSMLESGTLTLRVLQHISLDRLDDAIALGLRSGFGNDWLRVGGVKMFLDGALGSRTAHMREPYENTTDCGVVVMTERDFRDVVERAYENGISSVVHAIGDAAVTLALEVLTQSQSQSPSPSLPHRIEHVQCLPDDLAHYLDKGVICSVQPAHLMTDWPAADRHWGERGAHTYALRRMLDHGAVLACGSDAPVEAADPRHGLFAAVTRQDLARQPKAGWYPEQRITIDEAFAGYTVGPALAAGVPRTKVGLAAGALADFVVWPQDPLKIDAAELLSLTPAATVVGGAIVYRN